MKKIGLILTKERHYEKGWTCTLTPKLVEALLKRFECSWMENQKDYENHLGDVDVLLSFEPVWAAPALKFRRRKAVREKFDSLPSMMMFSDPHKDGWRQNYFLKNRIDRVLAYYFHPTLRHFTKIPPERIVHFTWAVPDEWIGSQPLQYHGGDKIACFGAGKHEAYDVRNWCRSFPFVEATYNSGVENKQMSDLEYIRWLQAKDAAVAAGSDHPKYRLTTPKYYEIAASGALLFAQETDDLKRLGFEHGLNCLVFNRDNFEALAREYLADPESYTPIREGGRELIRERHSLSRRLDFLESIIEEIAATKKSG